VSGGTRPTTAGRARTGAVSAGADRASSRFPAPGSASASSRARGPPGAREERRLDAVGVGAHAKADRPACATVNEKRRDWLGPSSTSGPRPSPIGTTGVTVTRRPVQRPLGDGADRHLGRGPGRRVQRTPRGGARRPRARPAPHRCQGRSRRSHVEEHRRVRVETERLRGTVESDGSRRLHAERPTGPRDGSRGRLAHRHDQARAVRQHERAARGRDVEVAAAAHLAVLGHEKGVAGGAPHVDAGGLGGRSHGEAECGGPRGLSFVRPSGREGGVRSAASRGRSRGVASRALARRKSVSRSSRSRRSLSPAPSPPSART